MGCQGEHRTPAVGLNHREGQGSSTWALRWPLTPALAQAATAPARLRPLLHVQEPDGPEAGVLPTNSS